MPTVRVTVDATEATKDLHEIQLRSLPYAMAASLTATAKDAQAEVKRGLGAKFTLRNRWTEQGIRITPAQKKSDVIQADVHTDTENRATGAPDYLGLQEDGGEKVPHGGRQHLAVPTKYLRSMCPGIIPAELRPRNLLAASATDGRYTARTRKGQMALRNQKIVRGFVFFLATLKTGHPAIMGRYFTEREAYPFYVLIPEANIKPRLHMEEDVERVVQQNFEKNWDAVWSRIMERGIRV